MEFDNDRKIQPPYKTEIFFWIGFMILTPIVNTITFFWFDSVFFLALFFISVISFPLYVLYARVIIPKLLFQKKHLGFALSSVAFFVLTLLLIMGLNAFISSFSLKPAEQFFLSYSSRSLTRDGMWVIINMSLCL